MSQLIGRQRGVTACEMAGVSQKKEEEIIVVLQRSKLSRIKGPRGEDSTIMKLKSGNCFRQ